MIILSETADYLTVIGFPIAFVGLIIAIHQIQKVRSTSEAARFAVDNFRQDLNKYDTIGSFAEVLRSILELKRFIRYKNFEGVPDRLYEIRHMLITLRESGIISTSEHQKVFQDSISSFKLLEDNFEKKITNNDNENLNDHRTLQRISDHADSLKAVQIQLRKEMENNNE